MKVLKKDYDILKKYKEILRLKEMLENAKIPFTFEVLKTNYDYLYGLGVRYHISYPNAIQKVCSVVQGVGSYGGNEDKLEIMGLLTDKELKVNEVVGFLTAEEVFDRISSHYSFIHKPF